LFVSRTGGAFFQLSVPRIFWNLCLVKLDVTAVRLLLGSSLSTLEHCPTLGQNNLNRLV